MTLTSLPLIAGSSATVPTAHLTTESGGATTPLRVLLTNKNLTNLGGTQMYVSDVAQVLRRRGHTPIAFAPLLGDVADNLRKATVPIVDDLSLVSGPVDIIHGQHHPETMAALLHFSNVPAVYFCHGWDSWNLAPPRFPRIYRYVAVDELTYQRLVYEHGIPPDQVRLLLNFADLEKFQQRDSLPARPQRALLFGNDVNPSHAAIIREACQRTGITLDLVGRQIGTLCSQPEKILGSYDLVFAKARCAIEAMATGAAVILYGSVGLGPLVTRRNFAELRTRNFGMRTLRSAHEAGLVAQEIERFDAADARVVSQQIRASADQETVVDQIVEVYQEVLAEHSRRGPPDVAAEGRAAAAYLRWCLPVYYKNLELLLPESESRLQRLKHDAHARKRPKLLRWLSRWMPKSRLVPSR